MFKVGVRANALVTAIVVCSLVLTPISQAGGKAAGSAAQPEGPRFTPPPGRNGLGLGASENGNAADVPVQMVDGVNITNGNLLAGDIHYQFNGQGPTFGLQIAYNSQADSALSPFTPLGPKWTHNLNEFVDLDGLGHLNLHRGDGEVLTYPLACRPDVNRSGGLIDIIDIQLDAEHWNTPAFGPGSDPFFDVQVPLDGFVDIQDVQVVAGSFNRPCLEIDPTYWVWDTNLPDGIYATAGVLPGGDIRLATREGLAYTYFSPLSLSLTAGKLREVRDRNGSGYELLYDPDGRLVDAANSSGAALHFAYDPSTCPAPVPLLSSVSDHTGRTMAYQYDPATCDLIQVMRYGLPARHYGYLPNSLLRQEVDANGAATLFAYDGSQRVVSRQQPDSSAPQLYNYTVPGLTQVTDPAGRQGLYQYDPLGRVVQIERPASGQVLSFQHDARGNLIHLGGPGGNHFDYDSRGNVLRLETAHPDPGNPARLETLFTYDQCNQVETVTDPLLRQTQNVYEPDTCHLLQMIDPVGNTTTFVNNALGQPLAITDALGRTTTNAYDPFGNLIAATDPAGHATTMTYDSLNRRIAEADGQGHVTTFGYDPFDRQTSITDPAGHVTTMTYDMVGNLLAATDPDGRTTTYGYDGRGNKISVTDNSGQVTTYEYDSVNRLTRTSDPLGRVTLVEYDAQDRPVQVTANALSTEPQVTGLGYDDASLTRTITNALGIATTFHFDRGGRVTEVLNPDGTATQYAFNEVGELLAVTDAMGRTEGSSYDAAGRKLSETDALGNTTLYEYDGAGNVVRITNALGYETTYEYDAMDRLTRVVDPLGNTTHLGYDPVGNLTSVVDPNGASTTFEYDANGNMLRVINPEAEATDLHYSPGGQFTGMQSPLGNQVQLSLDPLGRVDMVTQLGADGTVASTGFTYDAAGNRQSMSDANGHLWIYEYDAFDRLIRRTDPMGHTTLYRYDPLGNLRGEILADGHTVTYQYDPMNRLVATQYGDGSLTAQGYDSMGNVTQVSSFGPGGVPVAHNTFAYDARNRVVEASGLTEPGLAYAVDYGYDAVGNPIAKTYHLPGLALPAEVTLTWDPANRLTSIARADGSQLTQVDKVYDGAGRLVGSTAGSQGVVSAYTTYQYDSAGRVANIHHCADLGCATPLSSYDYAYDDDGNRVSEVSWKPGGLTVLQYQYDGQGRLMRERRESPPGVLVDQRSYGYDGAGNRLHEMNPVSGIETQYLVNPTGQIDARLEFLGPLLIHQVAYTYDVRGNLVSRQSVEPVLPPAQPVSESFEYDLEGRLVQYQNALSGQFETYSYDGLGNRVREEGSSGQKARVFDGPNLLAEYDVSGPPTLEASYLFGQEIDEPLARIDALSSDPSFFIRDALGSTRQLIDEAGAVLNDYEYTAFGELFSELVSVPNDILFAGRQFDPASGLYDYRTRAYDPVEGRFLQPDPIYEGLVLAACPACWQHPLELFHVMPLYSYVGNNPVTYSDPTGEQWWFWYPWWWIGRPGWYFLPYRWWGWWYGPWGWFGLRWWWWRWWWIGNPFWGGWWWWQWRWWWGGWWWPWWGNFWWPWWYWSWNWWWWPWWFGWGWWWYPWWWGGWWWPWWWFRWRGWWHWRWWWPFKWGWWCGWWWRWWWPWWWGGWWWPWWWWNWAGWRLGFWLGWGWWWWPWWWGGYWWPWWFGWGWWPWWGGYWWWPWWWRWWSWRPWWWGTWWWGNWIWWAGWAWWPGWWGGWWWPWWWRCRWSLWPWWWGGWWIWGRWWWPWRWWWWRPWWRWWPWWRPWWPWWWFGRARI